MSNRLTEIMQLGQSIWYDNIRRAMITTGELQKKIEEDDLRGVTSNPTIFEKAITGSGDYDEQLRRLVQAGKGVSEIYEDLVAEDIGNAADILLPVYERTGGLDGYISLEVNPALAYKTQETIDEAERLFKRLGRKNVMIKIPASQEGIPAIEESIYRGVNINITMIFSIENYEQVAEAFIKGLERRAAEGKNVDHIASVASFFVSRVDTAVDTDLEHKARHASTPEEAERLKSLLGRAAVANAKLAYQKFKEIFHGPRFAELKSKGAQVQRCLWASTGTKNPEYSDVLYVDNLIGPETVNTVPPATYTAILDHGKVALTLEEGLEECRALIGQLSEVGIDLKAVTEKLQKDGLEAFVKSFDTLAESIRAKRDALFAEEVWHPRVSAAGHDEAIEAAARRLDDENVIERFWGRDASLWKPGDEAHRKVIADSLGWMSVAGEMLGKVDELASFAEEIRGEGFKHVLLLGMGGSSLCAEVMRRTFGRIEGYPELLVLDSTLPESVRSFRGQIDPAKTLFVVASKSGKKVEPQVFLEYFFAETARALDGPAGRNFVAITDPGSPLAETAVARGFRRTFLNPSDIGGRYSALSYFGLVPAALAGYDVRGMLGRAAGAERACREQTKAAENPGAHLGVALGALALAGRDKLTLVTSPPFEALGLWIEQLIAESTGKEGSGILPVAGGETLGDPGVYGPDRVFVSVAADDAGQEEQKLQTLERAGHPVIRLRLRDSADLGEAFYVWEFATPLAGYLLGIDPFDQPNVQESLENTEQLLGVYASEGALPERDATEEGDVRIYVGARAREAAHKGEGGTLASAVSDFLAQFGGGDYFALLPFVEETPEHQRLLEEICEHVRATWRVATTIGYGPRYLHSTGQLHKGGKPNGVFLQVTADEREDIEIPNKPYSFGVVAAAQALGDFNSLSNRSLRVLCFHCGSDTVAGLTALRDLVVEATRARAGVAGG